ncbi:MAG: efflux RND transporter permease subunit [Bryobacterales bacterium]|nr:efflux RND transporter permease subunit [Bryobacterales bacterium]MBV9401416.1 efflux RND transporter permease subunit [Bryobacterales bacterium]
MNLSEIFIRRPIATSLLMAAIALFGVVAYFTLAVSDLPTVDFPTLNVQANLPGADPATMASSVATVLERQFTTIAGLDSMVSSSSTGQTQVTLQFSLDRDIDSAAVDVETAIAEVLPLLPPMPFPPSFKKQNPSDQPIMQMTLTSPTLPMSQLDDYAENLVMPRLSTINGVSQVNVQGQQKYAVRVQVDPDKLVSKRIGLNEVDAAIAAANPNLPTGTLFGPMQTFTLTTNAELKNAAQFGNVVVAYRNKAPVRLNEIADVVDSVQETRSAAWVYTANTQQRSVQLQVMRQPGANTIAVTDAIKATIPQLQSQLPPSATLGVRFDRAKTIRQSFDDIQVTMLVTLLLVIGVIFLFLRNASATIIPSMALPFALLGTFAMMAVFKYSLDNLSLMALILSIGFVVDDAIVMLENIMRHIEHGESPMEASLKGSKEIGFTIISMTISLAAVFIPILFMGGILGRLFREFAVTITTAILISGLVSVTLTPMLCSRFLKVRPKGTEPWWSRWAEWCFQQTYRGYEWSLRRVLKWRPVMAIVFVGVLALTVHLFKIVPTGFIPDVDQDQLQVNLQAAQGTSFYKMVEYQKRLADILRADPNVETFLANVGNGNYNQMQVTLKPRKDRPLSAQQLADKLRPKISNFPGFRVYVNLPQAIRIGGRQSSSNYQFTLQAFDNDELYKWAEIMAEDISKLPQVADVGTDLQMKNPLMSVVIDRERAALYGLNAKQIENALYSAYGPELTSNIYTAVNQYQVLEEMKPKYQEWTDYLSKIYFKAGNGQLVPLDSLAKVTPSVGPQSIAHSGQLPSVTLSFNVKTGVSLGQAVSAVDELAARVLPPSVTGSFSGNAQMFQSSLSNLSLLLVVAIGVVYIVLGVLYESYIHPITILSGLPSAGVGALLTLIIFGNELNIYSFVGLVMLIGIVKKNAIMQIDFALEEERRTDKSPAEAIYQGCLIRFRPIMMTTMAAMLGALPMAMGYGAGGEARRPLGLCVVGGLMVSQLMTLYLTPVVYTYMSSILTWRRSRKAVRAPEPAMEFGD